MNKLVIDKLESAQQLNPSNFYSLYLLFVACWRGQRFFARHRLSDSSIKFYNLKLYDYSYMLLGHQAVSDGYKAVETECYCELALVFTLFNNYPAALKYSKLAYELCLRSSDHTQLSKFKDSYLRCRKLFAELPPLRSAVGDEVEFLHEFETGSVGEWKRGRVLELYYREIGFAIPFSSPYRLQLIEDSADQPPVYAWVKADTDRYVRKIGVRSIEDTRYQVRLDAKVAELTRVYCSDDFIHDIYNTLAQDRGFVEMLQSVWHVELSEHMLLVYRMYVMYTERLVRTDFGYHIPTAEEVIAGIRAFFDPAHLSGDVAPSATSYDS